MSDRIELAEQYSEQIRLLKAEIARLQAELAEAEQSHQEAMRQQRLTLAAESDGLRDTLTIVQASARLEIEQLQNKNKRLTEANQHIGEAVFMERNAHWKKEVEKLQSELDIYRKDHEAMEAARRLLIETHYIDELKAKDMGTPEIAGWAGVVYEEQLITSPFKDPADAILAAAKAVEGE